MGIWRRHTLTLHDAHSILFAMNAGQSSAEPSALLHATGLAAERGTRALFERLDLSLAAGSVTWLRGRNGRGKTSLLRVLAGLSSPTAGGVHIAGRTLHEGGPAWRRHLVYIGHQNALKDDLDAAEALHFLVRLHGGEAGADALAQALNRFDVGWLAHAPVRTLSQGQRRRVALARLLLSRDARLWLLDEPFDALDADGIDTLNSVIAEHAAAGGCVLLSSHQPLTLTRPLPVALDLEAYACA